MNPTLSPQRRQYHRERVRGRSRLIAWVSAPALMAAIAIWLVFEGFTCQGKPHGPIETFACDHASWVPDALGVVMVAALLWLVFAMTAYAEELLNRRRGSREWRVAHHVRSAGPAYRDLAGEHRASLLFAMEMSCWTAVFLIAYCAYYLWNFTPQLGVLVIAALARLIYALIRRIGSRSSTSSGPSAGSVPPSV